MPELPEFKSVAQGLRQSILGRRILSVRLGKTDFIDDLQCWGSRLAGRRNEAVERRSAFRPAACPRDTPCAQTDAGPGGQLAPGVSCKTFCKRRLPREGRRSPILLTPRGSRENISATIEPLDGKEGLLPSWNAGISTGP
jgi:hypothetical protein